MATCTICHFETELDDVAVGSGEHCVCLRCYARLTGTERPMPKALRREVLAALSELGAASPE